LALFGQTALLIFTAHMFVLPGLALMDRIVPLRGLSRVAAALLPFAAFCVLVLYGRHRRLARKSACVAGNERPGASALVGDEH
jgi:hypothetical protein